MPIDEPVTIEGERGGGRGAAARRPADRATTTAPSPSTSTRRPPARSPSKRSTRPATAPRSTSWCPSTTRTPSARVHVSAAAWADDELRAGIEDLIDRGLIDTVELDLKDESGIVGYDSELAKAQRDRRRHRRLRPLRDGRVPARSKGIRVIGRLVAFRDPIYANAAWAAGDRDQVIQTPDGGDVLHLRRLHELLPRRRAGVQPRHRARGRVDGREGHPLGLHPPSRGRPRHDGDPGPGGSELGVGHHVPRRDAARAATARRVPGRVGVRHRGGGRRQHRPGRAGDGRGGRLPGADGLPVALGPGHVPGRQPDQPALRHREEVAGRLPAGGAEHRRAVRCRGCRTSRSTACATASTRCASRSEPPRSSASTASCSGTPTSEYTDEALDPIP